MKEEVLARDFDLGFSGNSDDVVMHAIHLLGNCVNITNTSRNNEFFVTPSITIPAVFELNFYSNGILHVFIKEAVIGMFWGLSRKDFLVTLKVKVSAQKSPSVSHVTYFNIFFCFLFLPTFTLTNSFKANLCFVWRTFPFFFPLILYLSWKCLCIGHCHRHYQSSEPTWQNLCSGEQYFNEILFWSGITGHKIVVKSLFILEWHV